MSMLAVAERDSWLAAAVGRSQTVVDLGCGDGSLALLLAELGLRPARYVGLDLLEEHIATARSAVPWGEFVVGSADRLPVPDGTADVVLMATLLSSLRERFLQEAVATEIARVLRPGGRLVCLRHPLPQPAEPRRRPDHRRPPGTPLSRLADRRPDDHPPPADREKRPGCRGPALSLARIDPVASLAHRRRPHPAVTGVRVDGGARLDLARPDARPQPGPLSRSSTTER